MPLKQDSRQIQPGDTFIAFEGDEADGHAFIEGALKNGADKIIFHDEYYRNLIPLNKQHFVLDTQFWLYESVLNKVKGKKIITISGSVGKTTTTKLIVHLLKNTNSNYSTNFYTPREGLNTLRGVSIDIINNYNDEPLLVCETGMDCFLELDQTARYLPSTINAVVNIDISHISKLKSMERILRTEFGMCTSENLEVLIANPQDSRMVNYLNTDYLELVNAGIFKKTNVVYAEPIEMPSFPKHFGINLGIATQVLKQLDIEIPKTQLGDLLTGFDFASNRFVVFKIGDVQILNDSYNASPLSYQAFFDYCKGVSGKKLGILGQINEIGPLSIREHTLIAKSALDVFDDIIFVGPELTAVAEAWGTKCETYTEALELIRTKDLTNYTFIGVKASRGIQLDKCVDFIKENLSEKSK